MILKEFTSHDASKLQKITRALSENYNYNINFSKMTATKASAIAGKARAKIEEHRDVNQRVKYSMIAESLDLWMQANVQTELTSYNLAEGLGDDDLEASKVILAAQELSDKIQGMIEDAAKMQVQDLMPIIDTMKSELGPNEAASFSDAADAALGGLVEALKSAKEQYDSAIAGAQGIAPASDMDNFDGDDFDDGDTDMDADIDGMDFDDADLEGGDDEFGGDDSTVGDDEPTGRAMKDEM